MSNTESSIRPRRSFIFSPGLVVVEGKLIEIPVLREMRRILSIAEKVAG